MGNVAYQGNAKSVINSNVLPRIHPTNPVDARWGYQIIKNLMFSIENLAVRVIQPK